MTFSPVTLWDWVLVALCCVATAYVVVAAFALPSARALARRSPRIGVLGVLGNRAYRPSEPVSVLKPLCGAEPRL
ncbi:MAG: glycosyl transferase, partial [Burkholderiales bacterium]|nr:glycosyl transferase [Burkholderiales bacterium]